MKWRKWLTYLKLSGLRLGLVIKFNVRLIEDGGKFSLYSCGAGFPGAGWKACPTCAWSLRPSHN